MRIFTCENCKYIFESEENVNQCPDCGKLAVRPATQTEVDEYNERKKEDVWQEE